MTELNQPLSTAELDELDDFLSSDAAPESAMDVSTLEGYLTAIAIGPQAVMPSRWLPWVWDIEAGKAEVAFADLNHANRIMALLMRFMNGIILTFMDDPESFEPIYWRAAHWGAAEWCEGFLRGTQFSKDAWNLLWVGKPTLVTPFLRLGTDEGIEITRQAGDAQQWMEAVEPSLVEIHAFWKDRRASRPAGLIEEDFYAGHQRSPVTRLVPKVGRNDPCPCGSGKKFKKCCGSDGPTLH